MMGPGRLLQDKALAGSIFAGHHVLFDLTEIGTIKITRNPKVNGWIKTHFARCIG